MKLVRVATVHPDFKHLIAKLDMELSARYGLAQSVYDQHNKTDPIRAALIGYIDARPVVCGCFKAMDDQTIEIKRMYVVEDCRRQSLAEKLLQALKNEHRAEKE